MQSNTTPTIPGHTPAKKSRRWFRPVAFTAVGVLTLLVGVGIGSAGEKVETVTIDRPVEVEKIVTETETVEVPVTPEACITALDLSGDALMLGSDVITLQTEVLMIAADALENPFAADQAGIDRIGVITAEIEGKTADMEAMTPDAGAASQECRGAL